jgi:hypothetical protein
METTPNLLSGIAALPLALVAVVVWAFFFVFQWGGLRLLY